jgi:hypothetical protein
MATNLTISANIDVVDAPYASGASWVDLDLSNDTMIFTAGSDVVKDGEPIPSQTALNQAGIILTGTEQIVSQYFVADASANILRQIDLMGNTTNRYVLAFTFDGPTATEPILELWDDITLNTIDSTTLGAGTPANSWWRGITTTNSAPSIDWVGLNLAGSSDLHYLQLNDGNGPLIGATTLYCNLKVVIPASATTGTSATPIIVVKFASN